MLHTGDGLGPLAAALLLGHFAGDFLFQTRRMVERKRQLSGTLAHALVLYLVHVIAVFAAFQWAPRALAVLAGVVVAHLVIDHLKIAFGKTRIDPLALFFADQLLHLVTLGVAFTFLDGRLAQRLDPDFLATYIDVAVIISAVAFTVTGGAAVVRLALARIDHPDDTLHPIAPEGGVSTPRAGSIIGKLERALVLLLVALGQWGAVGLVFAAKSIARFEDLKHRPFAEYYLVGTLTSFLVAVVAGVIVRWLV